MSNTPRIRAGLVALALVAGLTAPALAGDQIKVIAQSRASNTQSTVVRVSDLDLTTYAGHIALDRRLARAASAVCERDYLYSSETRGDYARCYSAAVQRGWSAAQQRVALGQTGAIRLGGS